MNLRPWFFGTAMLVVCLWLTGGARAAQAPARATATAPPKKTYTAEELAQIEAERQKVLQTSRWMHMEDSLFRWLDRQRIFSKKDVADIKQRWTLRVSRMTAEQLQQLLDETEKRMQVLQSADGIAAQNWLAQFLAVQAIYPEIEVKRKFLDWLKLSPDEMLAQLQNFQAERSKTRDRQASFDTERKAENDEARRVREAAEKAAIASAARPVGGGSGGGYNFFQPYKPRPYVPPSGPRMYVGPWGNVGTYLGGFRY